MNESVKTLVRTYRALNETALETLEEAEEYYKKSIGGDN